jgi:hypothetical protein
MYPSRHSPFLHPVARDEIEAKVTEVLIKTSAYVLKTADYERGDRLWPADFLVFSTNPLNVAYGACGPALFLSTCSTLPADVTDWMLKQPLNVEAYPPGLYLGLAGVAYTFEEIGLRDQAERIMEITFGSPLLYNDPSMLLGSAGWGLASLYFFYRTRKLIYLEWALRAGEHLLHSAFEDDDTCHWRCDLDGQVHFGFGYGASGIALFLAHLHIATGRAEFRASAIRGLEFDLANKTEGELGWGWQRTEGDNVSMPYWIHGSAGVGGVAIRISRLLGIQRYDALARRIADDAFLKYSVFPGLFDGLTGIAELMLDMFHFTGDEIYRDRAFDIAETLLWFGIERTEGVAWPGNWLSRISNDYATGAAGIGLFFQRLLRPGDRLLVDICPISAGRSGVFPAMTDRGGSPGNRRSDSGAFR